MGSSTLKTIALLFLVICVSGALVFLYFYTRKLREEANIGDVLSTIDPSEISGPLRDPVYPEFSNEEAFLVVVSTGKVRLRSVDVNQGTVVNLMVLDAITSARDGSLKEIGVVIQGYRPEDTDGVLDYTLSMIAEQRGLSPPGVDALSDVRFLRQIFPRGSLWKVGFRVEPMPTDERSEEFDPTLPWVSIVRLLDGVNFINYTHLKYFVNTGLLFEYQGIIVPNRISAYEPI